MSDYELVDLFTEQLNTLQSSFMDYVAVLFAFLIAAYLVAAKLESRMVTVIVVLFTVVALQHVLPILASGSDFAGVAGQIALRATNDSSSVNWHGAAMPWGPVAISITRYSAVVALIVSYIGGLIFFFHQRRVGRAQ